MEAPAEAAHRSPSGPRDWPGWPGWPGWIVLAIALGVYVAGALRFDFLIDDAFISFRYAKNWADGLGLRYNAGVDPPVEGYSNFLWMALGSLGYRLGVPLEVSSRVLSATCGALLLVSMHRWLRTRGLGLAAVASADLVFASSACVHTWATSGLETMAFTTVFCALVFVLLDIGRDEVERRPSAVLAGLLALILALLRVEGALWALALPGLVALGGGSRVLRRLVPYAAVLGIGYAGFVIARYVHFDAWTANTVHVKAGFSFAKLVRGLKTDASFVLSFLSPLVLLAAVPLAWRGRHAREARVVGLGLLALLGYNALVGGDWMPFFRFLVPFFALGGVALALAVERLGPRGGGVLAVLAVAGGLGPAFDVLIVPRAVRAAVYFRTFEGGYQTELERLRTTTRNGRNFEQIGRALSQLARPGDTIVVGAIGAIGFYSGLFVHDRNGLVDREVAATAPVDPTATAGHEKRVPWSWFADRRPTYYEPVRFDAQATLRAAAGVHARRLFRKDPALRQACTPEKFVPQDADGLEPGFALLVLRGTDDAATADASWDRWLP